MLMTSIPILMIGFKKCGYVFAVGGTLGELFIVQTPYINGGNTVFLVFTFEQVVQVNLTSPGERDEYKRSVLVHRLETGVMETNLTDESHGARLGGSFVLRGNGFFGVCVYFAKSGNISDSFIALPVKGWGKGYTIVTLRRQPSFIVVACLDLTQVDIEVHNHDGALRVSYRGEDRIHGSRFRVELNKETSFTFEQCDHDNVVQPLTGTTVHGNNPIGVITGSCFSDSNVRECKTRAEQPVVKSELLMNSVVEMLLPHESFGREFIVGKFLLVTSRLSVLVCSLQASTRVTVNAVVHELEAAGQTLTVSAGAVPVHVGSDHPVQVVLVVHSGCLINGSVGQPGRPAISILPPIVLYLNAYIWTTPIISDDDVINCVTLVVVKSHVAFVRFDDVMVSGSIDQWSAIAGIETYTSTAFTVLEGSHVVYAGDLMFFGCYVYGAGRLHAYMFPGGYMAAAINSPCHVTASVPGDLIDNDCDGRIDEEKDDEIDNDNDRRVDEDVGVLRRNGKWGSWGSWRCEKNCGQSDHVRERLCNNPASSGGGEPCAEHSTHRRKGTCINVQPCAEMCVRGTYGAKCSERCLQCDNGCHEISGLCHECRPGFMLASRSCQVTCPPWTYGAGCTRSCIEKCKTDCLDRRSGSCPALRSVLLQLSLLGLVVMACCIYVAFVLLIQPGIESKNKEEPGFIF